MTAVTAQAPLAPARHRVAPGVALRHGLTLAWRSIMQIKHSPDKLMDVTLMPIIFLCLFLYVFGGAVAGSTSAYLQVLLPGMVAQMVMFASIGLGVNLNEDISKGVFDRFKSMPIARSAPLVGAVFGDAVRFAITIVILLGFGSVLGFRFHTDPWQAIAAVLLAYVFAFALSWLSAFMGLLAKSPQVVQGISMLWVMPLMFGSNIMISNIATMPGWLQAWVKVSPITQLVDSCRALMTGGALGNHVWYTLAWAVGMFVVFFPAAMWAYRRHA